MDSIVSIGVPVYNEEQYLEESLNSLLNQSYANIEIIISDNCSTDRTQEICEFYAKKDSRIKYLRQKTNQGAIENFDTVIRLAQGDFFMFAAGHDLWHPDFILNCIKFIGLDDTIALCYPQAMHIDKHGSIITQIPGSIDTRGLDRLSRVMVALWGIGYGFPIYGLIRTWVIKKIKLGLKIVARDILMLCEISYYGSIAHIPMPLIYMRKLPDFGNWERYVRKCIGEESITNSRQLFQEMKRIFVYILLRLFKDHPDSPRLPELIRTSLDTKLAWIQSMSLQENRVLEPDRRDENTLTVIVDGVFFQLYQTGIARVWLALLNQWASTMFSRHLLLLDRENTCPDIPGIRKRVIHRFSYEEAEIDRLLLQEICDQEEASMFISSYYTTPLTTPSVFMAYDMIPEMLYNIQKLEHPMWKNKHLAISRASRFICISNSTANDLRSFSPEISPHQITVAHCGVDPLFHPRSVAEIDAFTHKYGIKQRYFLHVGGRIEYKNMEVFLKGFAMLTNKDDFDIVCTGNTVLEDHLRDIIPGTTVHLLRLTDEELCLAYCGATALVYPSKYEGFGLPIIEAISSGCPVITSQVSSIPEVAGDAALYIDPNSAISMLQGLISIQDEDIRQELREKGLEQAKQFSWEKMARITQDTLVKLTLSDLGLRSCNLVAIPDWNVQIDLLYEELTILIRNILKSRDRQGITLLLAANPVSDYGDREAVLNEITLNLMAEDEELQLADDLPNLMVVDSLSLIQWETLIPQLSHYIALPSENSEHPLFSRLAQLPRWS